MHFIARDIERILAASRNSFFEQQQSSISSRRLIAHSFLPRNNHSFQASGWLVKPLFLAHKSTWRRVPVSLPKYNATIVFSNFSFEVSRVPASHCLFIQKYAAVRSPAIKSLILWKPLDVDIMECTSAAYLCCNWFQCKSAHQ